MPDTNAWLSSTLTIEAAPRAVAAWKRIQDKPTLVTFSREVGAAPAADQPVRVELNAGGEATGPTAKTSTQGVVVFGVKDHPTEDDTDMQRGDRFWLDDKEYEITSVILTFGEIQGTAEARG